MTGLYGTTEGPWAWADNAMSNGKPDTWSNSGLAALTSDNDVVCWFGNAEQYYPTEGDEPSDADKRAIALVPEMLAMVKAVSSGIIGVDEVDFARAIAAKLEEK